MKQKSRRRALRPLLFAGSLLMLPAAFLLFCSFTTTRLTKDFLAQLGISQSTADRKIIGVMLGTGFDPYGLKNAKNIALGNRKAVILDVINYAKKQASSPAYAKAYNEMRNPHRTEDFIPKTPEQMREDQIKSAREGVRKSEEAYKKADAQFKDIFLKSLEDSKKHLKEVEAPNNKNQVAYRENYTKFVKDAEQLNATRKANFLRDYPDNPLHYVKKQLQRCLEQIDGVDFDAQLTEKNGVKYFSNRTYESKGRYWKMAFRAGKEVVEPARAAVQQWINEIK